jgi:hypothetical protein
MPVQFPNYVEKFIAYVEFNLAGWSAKLDLESKSDEVERSFTVDAGFGNTNLVVQPVNRRSGPQDYRARYRTVLPSGYDQIFRTEIFASAVVTFGNQSATLGALFSGKDNGEVRSQCIIEEAAVEIQALTMATSIVACCSFDHTANSKRSGRGGHATLPNRGHPQVQLADRPKRQHMEG